MRRTSIEQALDSLLPTLNSSLPSALVELANSLLAQSRNRARSLKPEEEIARPYVCAEIACKRLKTRLNLPNTQSHPPCAPRIYKKLYAFLDPILQASAKRKREEPAVSSPSKIVPRRTNTRGSSSTPATTPSKNKPFAGTIGEGGRGHGADSEAPAWIMPLIRRLCNHFSTPQMAPHIFTGTMSVMRLASIYDQAETNRNNVSALVLALYFLVLDRMRRNDLSSDAHIAQVERALRIAGLDTDTQMDEVDDWVDKISKAGWATAQEWWHNVPEDVLDEKKAEVEDDEGEGLTLTKKRPTFNGDEHRGLLSGLGTMMQAKVDWLSEDHRLDYRKWKRSMLARVKQVEKQQAMTTALR